MEPIIVIIIAAFLYLIYSAVRGSGQRAEKPRGTTPRIAVSGMSYSFSEISADPNFPQVRSIRSKIRGVTKRNANGANRQHIIQQFCRSGDALFLAREPNNPADPNAILVGRIVSTDDPVKPQRGEQLGYLSRDLAQELAPRMDDDGFILMAKILDVTGGEDGRSLGVNIEIAEYMPVVPKASG